MIDAKLAATLARGTTLYHRSATNADGTPMRCRVTGRCRLWKRDPERFRLPVKHGLRDCFYITPANGDLWSLTDPTLAQRADAQRQKRRRLFLEKFGLADDVPAGVLRDALLDAGYSEPVADLIVAQ